MGFKKVLSVILFLVGFGLTAMAQRDSISLTTLVAKTEKLSEDHPFEKVYLHFDKPYYAVGDTIWFKGYLTIGAKHRLSGLSQVIYIDVINSQDSLVQALRLPAVNGVTIGDVVLARPLYRQGNYHIRAYSNWMRNFGPEYFFNKAISIGDGVYRTISPKISYQKIKKNNENVITAKLIFKDADGNLYSEKKVSWFVQNGDAIIAKGKGTTDNTGAFNINLQGSQLAGASSPNLVTVIETTNKKLVTNTFPLKNAIAEADIQFFPEGGELIVGVRSKVAFKAISPDGLGVEVTGSVTDNTGNEVASISTQHAGMGIFALLPEADKSYKAVLNFPDGSKHEYELPKISNGGITLGISNNDPTDLNIKVATNAAFMHEYRNKAFYIVAQGGGNIYYTGLATLQSLVYRAAVPKNKFPTGVLQVTLLASNGEPISERLVFIDHHDALNISVTGNQAAYNRFQQVRLGMAAKNTTAAIEGSFSVAVIDETKTPFGEDAETTILSSLLLTSDLRGFIEKPNYYFNHIDDQKTADLDVLMLTQGYRRFSWSDVLSDKYPPTTFSPEKGIEITGTLRTASGLPVNQGDVNMMVPDRNFSVNTQTDAEGHFRFSNVSIYDSSKLVITGRKSAGSVNMMIMTDIPSLQKITPDYANPNMSADSDSTMRPYLLNSKMKNEKFNMLREVVIKGQKSTAIPHVSYPALSGLSINPDQVLGQETIKYCSSDFRSCVMSKIFGVWNTNDTYYIKKDYDGGDKRPVKFFVNGLAVENNYLNLLHPADVESLEVYLKDNATGTMRFYDCNGIISVTTKSHSFNHTDNQKSGDLKTGDLSFLTSQNSKVTITPKGYYKSRVFYSPKYDDQKNSQGIIDLRSTIYWNPNIITDKNGNASFDFYNAGSPGTYKAVIEGIDNEGNIGRFVLRYEVR
jgi:hypothetical protein